MPKVYPAQATDRATNPEPRVQDEQVSLVSELSVEPVSSEDTILLRLRDPHQDDGLVFALSPPAAKQLAEALEKAVDDYLHSVPEKPFDVSDYVL